MRALCLITLVLAACGDEAVSALDRAPDAPPVAVIREGVYLDPPALDPTIDDDNPEPLLGPPYPIVLVHGFSGFATLGPLEYFFGVEEALEDAGYDVYAPALPPYNDSTDRAEVLAAYIDEVRTGTGRQKVHIIAHSQGGIDSRRVLAGLGFEDKIASLTTVATPHRGTSLADDAAAAPPGLLNPAGRALAFVIGALDDPPNDDDVSGDGWDPALADAMQQMTTAGMLEFNLAHPDPEGVPIYSVAGYSNLQGPPDFCDAARFEASSRRDTIDALLVGPALLISGLSFRHNDGIVPTDSMPWGELLACVPADHFDEVGQIADIISPVFSGFDHRGLFLDIAAVLQDEAE